jgi:hypothetical protein
MSRYLRYALMILAVALIVHFVRVTLDNLKTTSGFDFYIYYANAQIAGRPDIPNIYAPDVQVRVGEELYLQAQYTGSDRQWHAARSRRRLDSVSSPFLYTTLGWLSPVYERAIRHYHVLLMTSFLIGVAVLCLTARLPPVGTLFLLAFLVGWYFPFHGDLIVGNVNSLQLIVLALAIAASHRWPLVAGFLLGILLSFKPNLILVLVLLIASRLLTRDFARLRREVIGGAVGGLTAFVAAAIHYGDARVWLYWLTAAGEFWERFPPRSDRNVAPALPLFQQYGSWPSYVIATLLLAIVVGAIFRSRKRDDLLIAGLGINIYLLSATVVWVHYLVLMLPIAVALMRRKQTAAVGILAIIVVAGNPLEAAVGKSMIPFEATVILYALIALFVAGTWMLWTGRPDPSLRYKSSDSGAEGDLVRPLPNFRRQVEGI